MMLVDGLLTKNCYECSLDNRFERAQDRDEARPGTTWPRRNREDDGSETRLTERYKMD